MLDNKDIKMGSKLIRHIFGRNVNLAVLKIMVWIQLSLMKFV